MITIRRTLLVVNVVLLSAAASWGQSETVRRVEVGARPQSDHPVRFAALGGSSARFFLVEAGGDPTATAPNSNVDVVAQPGTTITFDIYAEITGGGSVDVAGYQFTMACASSGGDGGAVTYDPASVTSTGDHILGCGVSPFDTTNAGDCSVPDEPSGLSALGLGNFCALSSPALVGTISYVVPADAATYTPSVNPYVIGFENHARSFIADENQNALPNLILDGAKVTILNGQCCDGMTCLAGGGTDGQSTEAECADLSTTAQWIAGASCLDACPCVSDTDCADGLFCNGQETCDAGTCVPGTAECPGELCCEDTDECVSTCCSDADCDDGDPTTVDTCDRQNQVCTHPARIDCFDNSQCSVSDYCAKALGDCNGTGQCEERPQVCTPVMQPVCDCDGHTYDNACEAAAAGVNVALDVTCPMCDDGLFCNGVETLEFGQCIHGQPPCNGLCCEDVDQCGVDCCDDTECDDGIACTTDSCDLASGCLHTPDDAACDDGNACTIDTCDASLGCLHDGTGITVDCDDNNVCTTGDLCQGDAAGTCGGTPIDCSSMDDACNEGACNPVTGVCEPVPINDGQSCDDGNLCTVGDVCHGGSCDGTQKICSTLDMGCTKGVCNPTTGVCEPMPIPDGGSCDDNNLCTENDTCQSSVCSGTTVDCDDHTTCTVDSCDPVHGCVHDDSSCLGNITINQNSVDDCFDPTDNCYKEDGELCVTIDISNLGDQLISGAQFFLTYDSSLLEFEGISPGDHPRPETAGCVFADVSPFLIEIFRCTPLSPPSDNCNPTAGKIGYAVSIPFGTPGAGDSTLATIKFKALATAGSGSIAFDPSRADPNNLPITQLVDVNGSTQYTLPGADFGVSVDPDTPVFIGCDDITLPNDPTMCSAVVPSLGCDAMDDGCGPAPGKGGVPGGTVCSLTCSRSDGLDCFTDPYPVGDTTLTWTAMDCACNESTKTQIVTVEDKENPTITCPADIQETVDPGECGAVVDYPDPTVDDNCPGVTWVCDHPSGSFFDVGTTTVTCTATDAHGNSESCSFDITVTDDEDPTITCPGDITQTADPGECGAIVDYPDPVVDDNCPGVTWVCDHASGSFFDVGTTTVCCVATDAADNTAQCCFDITITDDEYPVITCPADIVGKSAPGECGAIVDYPDPVVDDNCPGVTWVCDPPSGSFFDVGITPVSCTATDAHQHSTSCSFDVTITDDEDPTITCPADITQPVDMGVCGAVVDYPDPIADDNCPGVTWTCDHPSGEVFSVGTTPVCCIATDTSGNMDECCFNITVTDNEKPSINCPADMTETAELGRCGVFVNPNEPTFDDNCGVTTWSCTIPPDGFDFPVGTTPVACVAADAAGNSIGCRYDVTITDTEKPVAIVPADIAQMADPGKCCAVVTYDAETDATDNCPGVVIDCDVTSGECFPVGTTPVTCTARDVAGNTDIASFSVSIREDQNPTITCPADIWQSADEGECGAFVDYPDPVADDNCPGVTWTCDHLSGSFFDVGTTTVCCTATDAGGLTDQCCFDITVTDDEDPTIACPADITKSADPGECGAIVDYPDPMADDNCPGVTWVCDHLSGSFFDVGATTVCCTATDAAGNTDQCCFDITVTDNENPTSSCSADITQTADPEQCGAIVHYPDPVANDNCPGVIWQCDHPSGSFFDVGTTPVCCTATDAAGNTDQCCFDITVTDDENPTITCPADMTQSADPGQCGAIVHYPDPVAHDNCPGVMWQCDHPSGSFFDVGTTQVCCTATDTAGNADQCCFDIIVTDDENPVINCPEDITQQPADAGECSAFVDPGMASCTDNCGSCSVSCLRNDKQDCSSDPYPVGVTTLTWSATDSHGNSSACTQTVEVLDKSWLDLEVRLEGVTGVLDEPMTGDFINRVVRRCLGFGDYDKDRDNVWLTPMPTVVRYSCEPGTTGCDNGSVDGYSCKIGSPGDGCVGGFGITQVKVPSEATCICAKDKQHTLGRCLPLTIVGTHFAASFTENDSLVCGDANDDNLVDINDFGYLFANYLTPTPVNTTCGIDLHEPPPPPFHPEFNGDGIVNAFDFTCIVTNFLKRGDDMTSCYMVPCSGSTLSPAGIPQVVEIAGLRPGSVQLHSVVPLVSRAAVRRVDVSEMAGEIGADAALAADVDRNGILDARDIARFAEIKGIAIPERFRLIVAEEEVGAKSRQPAVRGTDRR